MRQVRGTRPKSELRVCYEAGPTGFVIARRFAQLGIDRTARPVPASLFPSASSVVAPSLIPNRSGIA